jgi:hypothetical protein
MYKPYSHVRFRWWDTVDLEKASGELGKSYEVKKVEYTEDPSSLYKEDRREIVVKADTLKASLSLFRVVLGQEKPEPFTAKDKQLRDRVRELYPHDRPTPFPWSFNPEPNFDAEKIG